ncbi:MAG: alpha/beta hydrolase [Pseudomonadota bacterium]
MLIAIAVAVTLAFAALGNALANRAKDQFEAEQPPKGQFVAVDGVRMHALLLGPDEVGDDNAVPVVLIHGASVNAGDMRVALGQALSKERRVLIVDRPGHGYSERPIDGWRLARQAQLIKGVADAFGVEKPIVVGQSYGGAVALRYALDYHDDISGLVGIAPVSHEWPGGVAWYNNVSGVPGVGHLLRWFVIPPLGKSLVKNDFASAFDPAPPPDNYGERAGGVLLFRPGAFRANAEDLRKLKGEIIDQSGRYGDIQHPTVIAVGTADTTVSPTLHAERLAVEIDGATILRFPEAGHPLHHLESATILDQIRRMASVAR